MVDVLPCNQGNRTLGLCNPQQGSPSLRGGGVDYTDYGYLVADWSVWVSLICVFRLTAIHSFFVVFLLGFIVHIGLGVWKRQWWMIWTVGIGAAIEVVGWGGRIWSIQTKAWDENLGGYYSYDHNSFIVQIVTLVIGPTFFSAALYILLGKLITHTGGLYCSLTPRSFSIIFIFADFLTLCVQGGGGGWAGTATDPDVSDKGAKLMSAGVIIQLVVTAAFIVLLAEFGWRYKNDRPARKQRHPLPNCGFLRRKGPDPTAHAINLPGRGNHLESNTSSTSGKNERGLTSRDMGIIGPKAVWTMFWVLVFATLLIVLRSFYRSIELTDGWRGSVAVNQALFLGMDAFLMALFVWAYIPFHPGFYLPRHQGRV